MSTRIKSIDKPLDILRRGPRSSLLECLESTHEDLDIAEEAGLKLGEEISELLEHLEQAQRETMGLNPQASGPIYHRGQRSLATAVKWIEVFDIRVSAESWILESSTRRARGSLDSLASSPSANRLFPALERLRAGTVRVGRNLLVSLEEARILSLKLESISSLSSDFRQARENGLQLLGELATSLEESVQSMREGTEILDASLGETRSQDAREGRWVASGLEDPA